MEVVYRDEDVLALRIPSQTRTFLEYDSLASSVEEQDVYRPRRLTLPDMLFAFTKNRNLAIAFYDEDGSLYVPSFPDVSPYTGLVCLGSGLRNVPNGLTIFTGLKKIEQLTEPMLAAFYETPFSYEIPEDFRSEHRITPEGLMAGVVKNGLSRFLKGVYVDFTREMRWGGTRMHKIPTFESIEDIPKGMPKEKVIYVVCIHEPVIQTPLDRHKIYATEVIR